MNQLVQWIFGLPPVLVLVLVFLLPALESSTFLGLLVPGEIAVLLGGVVARGGGLALWAVIVAAVAGAAVGDQIGYLVGRRYGDALLERLPRRLVRPDERERALRLVRDRGAVAVIIGRWAAALRALVPGIAGISRMPRATFTAANIAGGIAWAVIVAVLGYAAGASYMLLEHRLRIGGEVLFAVVAALIVYAVWRRRRGSRSLDKR